MFKNQEPPLIPRLGGSIRVREVSVVQLTAAALAQSPQATQATGLRPGPVLALEVSEALLTAARNQGGLLVKTGHAARGDSLLLSLLMRAGRHVAMCLADFGDPEVQACAMACLKGGRLPLLLRSESAALVSVSKLSDESRRCFNAARGSRASSEEAFAVAARQHVDMLSDDDFLREQGVDVSRVRSRTLLMHRSASAEDGSSGILGDCSSRGTTLH